MKRLWQIEWLKINGYRTFWVFVGIFMLSTLIVYWTFDKFVQFGPANLAQVYQFPVAWYFVSYVTSWFTPFLTLLMITLVSNEISFRTLRQHITDGMSPQEFLYSKVILAAVISFGAMLFAFLTGLIIGLTKGDLASSQNSFSMLDYLLRVFWNSFGLMTAGILLASVSYTHLAGVAFEAICHYNYGFLSLVFVGRTNHWESLARKCLWIFPVEQFGRIRAITV